MIVGAMIFALVGLAFATLAKLPVQYAPIACAVIALLFALGDIANAIRDAGRRES